MAKTALLPFILKANSAEKVFFSTNRFLSWEIMLLRKLEIEISVLKVVYQVGLVFSISNFLNKISQGKNRFVEKNTFSALFAFITRETAKKKLSNLAKILSRESSLIILVLPVYCKSVAY